MTRKGWVSGNRGAEQGVLHTTQALWWMGGKGLCGWKGRHAQEAGSFSKGC